MQWPIYCVSLMSMSCNERSSSAMLENAFSRSKNHIHVACPDKCGINPFYNVRKKNVKYIQELVKFEIARPC